MPDAHHRSEVGVARGGTSPRVLAAAGTESGGLFGKPGTPGDPEAASRRRVPAGWLIGPLTPRELQILGKVCDGDSNQEIATELQVSLDGVKYHLKNIFEKLGVSRRTRAVAVAIHAGLIAPEWLRRRR